MSLAFMLLENMALNLIISDLKQDYGKVNRPLQEDGLFVGECLRKALFIYLLSHQILCSRVLSVRGVLMPSKLLIAFGFLAVLWRYLSAFLGAGVWFCSSECVCVCVCESVRVFLFLLCYFCNYVCPL